jgi:hypothetical protein
MRILQYVAPERGTMRGVYCPKGRGYEGPQASNLYTLSDPRAAISPLEGVVKFRCPNEGVA